MSWLGTWAKRLKLTIDFSKIDTANLTDFPVLVHLSAASGIGDVDASAVFDELTSDANQKKIAITSSDGTTQLYCEVEKWSDADEEAWLHVKVPTVSYDADTVLYLYYDSSQADNTTYIGDTTDAVTHNVWDANFVGVWHMAQDPNGDVSNAIKDSTSNANDGTPGGSMTTADLVTGQVGKGIDFDASDDHILTGVLINTGSDFTISGCAKVTNKTQFSSFFGVNDSNTNRSYIGLRDGYYWFGVGDTQKYTVAASAVTNNVWFHWALRVSGSTATYFVNGVSVDSSSFSGGSVQSTNANVIGAANTGGDTIVATTYGTLDEVRLASTARSASWIKATYNSLWDSLITFGTEEIPLTPVSSEPLTGTFTFNSSGATLIYPVQQVFAEPLAGTFTLNSAGAQLFTPYYITGEPLTGTFALGADVRLIQRTLFNGSLTLTSSLYVGSTINIVNNLNLQLSSNLSLVMNITQALSGNLTLKMNINERAEVIGTLSLLNNLLSADSGITHGEYYFLRSHGL